VNYLGQYYNLEHEVFLYEAAQYPGFEPRIEKLPLNRLPQARLTPISTLYVPPSSKAICDEALLKALNINH